MCLPIILELDRFFNRWVNTCNYRIIILLNDVTENDTTNQRKTKNASLELTIGVTLAVLVALAFCIMNIIIIKRKKNGREQKATDENQGNRLNLNLI